MTELNSFYQHSLEEDAAWMKSASEHIFFGDLHIPLSAKMLKRALNVKLPRARVFHVTNAQYLDDMIKMQGKRKSISAATRMHHEVVTGGINVRGGMVFELEADVMVSAPNDIMSRPDKTGRRWLEWYMLNHHALKNGENIKAEIEQYGIKLKRELLYKYNPNAGRKGPLPLYQVTTEWSKLDPRNTSSALQKRIPFAVADKIPGLKGRGGEEPTFKEIKKILQYMIKDYIDAMEKVVAKYSTQIGKMFFAHAQTGNKKVGDGWDELVVNNYRIKSILLHDKTVMTGFSRKDVDVQEEHWEILMDKLEKLGIDYEVFDSAGDISREITMRSNLDFL